MNKSKIKKVAFSVISIVCIILLIVLGYKAYYFQHLNKIHFPENVRIINSSIDKCDIYGDHINVEILIETDLTRDEVREIVQKDSNENIDVFEAFYEKAIDRYTIEYDDGGRTLDQGFEAKEGMNYFVIYEHTPYFSYFWD